MLYYSNNYCVLSDGKLMGTSTNLYGEFGNNSYFYNPYFEQRNPISSIKKVTFFPFMMNVLPLLAFVYW